MDCIIVSFESKAITTLCAALMSASRSTFELRFDMSICVQTLSENFRTGRWPGKGWKNKKLFVSFEVVYTPMLIQIGSKELLDFRKALSHTEISWGFRRIRCTKIL